MGRRQWLRPFARGAAEAGSLRADPGRQTCAGNLATDHPDRLRQPSPRAPDTVDHHGSFAPVSGVLTGDREPAMFEEHDRYYGARLALVARINRDRTARGLSSLEFDELSSTVADRHCLEMAANQYLSHWDLQGLLPYHRYHLAGGRDHVQENLSRMTVISSDPHPISTEPSEVVKMLL